MDLGGNGSKFFHMLKHFANVVPCKESKIEVMLVIFIFHGICSTLINLVALRKLRIATSFTVTSL